VRDVRNGRRKGHFKILGLSPFVGFDSLPSRTTFIQGANSGAGPFFLIRPPSSVFTFMVTSLG